MVIWVFWDDLSGVWDSSVGLIRCVGILRMYVGTHPVVILILDCGNDIGCWYSFGWDIYIGPLG